MNRKTVLINAKVSHLRPKYNDLADWMKKKNHIYIGRGRIVFIDKNKISNNVDEKFYDNSEDEVETKITKIRFPFEDSSWANPFKVGRNGTLTEVLEKYEIYIREKISRKEMNIEELRGKTLACWCVETRTSKVKPRAEWKCHGECLLSILNE